MYLRDEPPLLCALLYGTLKQCQQNARLSIFFGHLATRVSRDKITMIPYGAIRVSDADESLIDQYGVEKNNYSIVIARPEPENSIIEIVKAFCMCPRKGKLLVLGSFFPDSNHYHREIFETANDSVIFPGAIYDADTIAALRFYSRFYIHGHQVGGTNPSLVEYKIY